MKLPITGGCHCGAVRYECSAEPVLTVNCHCRDCQYSSGTSRTTVFGVPTAALTITGTPKHYQSKSDRGVGVTRSFCGECGSPLFSENEAAGGQFMAVKFSTLDDPSWFKPKVDVWTCSAPPWEIMSEETKKFEKDFELP